ncbi:hypothetical protein EV641_11412 [Rhodococcus sp. SMB37]|nr:hypothetical protein EV641_11412 [Rhodococcus sp. SMB37]
MILYDFGCDNGHCFEAAVPNMNSPAPSCIACGGATRRRPTRVRMGAVASAGPSREQMPNTWRSVRGGDRETVAHWHTLARRRESLEERYPELSGDRRPVLAHEGIFADRPLRAGDDIQASVADALATGGGHAHSHGSSKNTAKEGDTA